MAGTCFKRSTVASILDFQFAELQLGNHACAKKAALAALVADGG